MPEWIPIHELAHFVADEGHGSRWARSYIELLVRGLSPRHGLAMLLAFVDFGLPVADPLRVGDRRSFQVARIGSGESVIRWSYCG